MEASDFIMPLLSGLVAGIVILLCFIKVLLKNGKKGNPGTGSMENGFTELRVDHTEIKGLLRQMNETLQRIEEKIR